MARKPTVHSLLKQKGTRQSPQVYVDTPEEAVAALEAGIEILSCEAGADLRTIRAAVPDAFLSAGMAHGPVASAEEAIRAGFALLNEGGDTVHCAHSPFLVEAMAREGIPVTSNVGLVPNLAAWTGFRAIGRTTGEALAVLRKARDPENAGCAMLEVEVVPVELARFITQGTPMLTMGLGCGDACDTQDLFGCDMPGTNTGHDPRHAKRYADLAALETQMQAARVAGFRAFVADLNAGQYPESRHEIHMDRAALAEVTARLDARGGN